MPPDRPPGPFDSEREARELPAVRKVYEAFDRDPGVGKMAPHNHRMILDALAAAGVYLGAYDHRIAEWLAGWEPQTVAVIAGWVARARLAVDGRAADDEAAVRADELLDRRRDGPRPLTPTGGRPTSSPVQSAEAMPDQATPRRRQSGESREATS
jgi:hypothetical protein